PFTAQAGSDQTHGYWLTENGKAIVQFAECGGSTCGKMVWIAQSRDKSGKLKLDLKNTDNAKRARPLCGLTLVGGLKEKGKVLDGWIYNPRDGDTYSVNVQPLSPQKLKVRGYVGVELFGSSQVWKRVASDRGGC
ncbi:MAG: DUF2147 domain-containing protein, partial [Paracoccaceae bacterium]